MGLLDTIAETYMRNVGNPSRQLVGNGLRGLLGLDPADYADTLGMEAYRNAQALSNAPTPLAFAALPAAVVKGAKAAKAVKAAPREEALETARKNAVKMLGLPENNTAMDRAKALGFDTPAAHFSRHGIDVAELDSGKFAIAPFDAVGTHVGSEKAALERFKNTVGYKVNNPSYANDELKGVTYPVIIRRGKELLGPDNKPSSEQALSMAWSEKADYGNLRKSNADLRKEVFGKRDSVPYINDVEAAGEVSYILPPQNIRSRFAAFDPARVNENDLLGAADLRLLGLLALGTGAGTLALSERAK